jgi:hypothetical protein
MYESSRDDMETVNELRKKMILMAEEKGSLTHPEVVRISQRLDVLIMKVM